GLVERDGKLGLIDRGRQLHPELVQLRSKRGERKARARFLNSELDFQDICPGSVQCSRCLDRKLSGLKKLLRALDEYVSVGFGHRHTLILPHTLQWAIKR